MSHQNQVFCYSRIIYIVLTLSHLFPFGNRQPSISTFLVKVEPKSRLGGNWLYFLPAGRQVSLSLT
jgi:hypothetical protein